MSTATRSGLASYSQMKRSKKFWKTKITLVFTVILISIAVDFTPERSKVLTQCFTEWVKGDNDAVLCWDKI